MSKISSEEVRWATGFAAEFYKILMEFLPANTTVRELRVLTVMVQMVAEGEEITLSQVKKRAGVSKSAAGRMIEKVLERGYYVAEPDASDGRKMRLRMTPEAEAGNREWAGLLMAALRADPPPLELT